MTLTRPSHTRRLLRSIALAAAITVVVAACGTDAAPTGAGGTSPGPSAGTSAVPTVSPSPTSGEMVDAGPGACEAVLTLVERVGELREVPLRLQNRVSLDIELGKVQSAFAEVRRADLGELDAQLEDPLRRLGYRLIDLEIAVEDFRTNRRIKDAAAHVETDASAMDDAVAGFAILARC